MHGTERRRDFPATQGREMAWTAAELRLHDPPERPGPETPGPICHGGHIPLLSGPPPTQLNNSPQPVIQPPGRGHTCHVPLPWVLE